MALVSSAGKEGNAVLVVDVVRVVAGGAGIRLPIGFVIDGGTEHQRRRAGAGVVADQQVARAAIRLHGLVVAGARPGAGVGRVAIVDRDVKENVRDSNALAARVGAGVVSAQVADRDRSDGVRPEIEADVAGRLAVGRPAVALIPGEVGLVVQDYDGPQRDGDGGIAHMLLAPL